MNEKKQFYSDVIKGYPDSETALLLQQNEDCDYYELCQKFLDVALNAPKILNNDGSLCGVFQHSDINIAKNHAINFIINTGIKDLDSFFTILELNYPLSVSSDDPRQKLGVVREKNTGYIGYFGTLYPFTHINKEIYDEMVADIKSKVR